MPAMVLITLLWGVLGGMNANINQYWITTAAPEAPDFANGLFLTAANLGTALGSAVCGMVIAHMGMQYMMWGGIVFLILCLAMIIPGYIDQMSMFAWEKANSCAVKIKSRHSSQESSNFL